MVKKKRNDVEDGSTTESCDENQSNSNSTSPTCSHLSKSVDPTKLRKILKTSGIQSSKCSECLKQPPTSLLIKDDDMFEYDNTLWLCLKCGSQLCGRGKNQHALDHFKTPRSDCHAIAVDTTSFNIWCYDCDNEVNVNSSKKLLECISIVRREAQRQPPENEVANNIQNNIIATLDAMKPILDGINNSITSNPAPEPSTSVSFTIDFPSQKKQYSVSKETYKSTLDVLPRVRGLSNLGNTCFFNAVVQCLAQTPFLLEVLKESSEAGEKFQLPGGKLKINKEDEIDLPSICGELGLWLSFTSTMSETLEELQTVSGGVYTPNKLLHQLIMKWPQFGGGDQHDSHELLRHLLESVRSDDLRRYQAVILNCLGYNTKHDPQSVDEKTKQKIKFYGLQATDRILKPEPVFRGFLVSTLTCQDCHNSSSRHEYFLDISLPVSTEKPQPPARRKTSPEPSSSFAMSSSPIATVSKSQLKKEKRMDRKAKRANKHSARKLQHSSFDSPSVVNEVGDSIDDISTRDKDDDSSSVSSSLSESDADIEDNVTDDPQKNHRTSMACDANGNNDMKSPQNPEKRDDSPENPFKDKDAQSPIVDAEMADFEPITGYATTTSNNVVLEASMSVTGIAQLLNKQQQENLSEDVSQKLKLDDNVEDDIIKAQKLRQQQQRIRQRTLSHMDWSTTLAPRYLCADGELSLQSCLNNFTAMELMTGNNKVGCEACTERTNGKNGKTVYTNATKQFLISLPPAVLILHLKRFQVGPRCMFRKITKHVTFPLILDVAPFCGSMVKKLPNIKPKQKKLLYSLYGIVEHSGGMHGGHYVAYVKVRSKLGEKDDRWKYLPKGTKAELEQIDEQKACLEEQMEKAKQRAISMTQNDSDDSLDLSSSSSSSEDNEEGAVGGAEIDEPTVGPPGKWYYVSDSRVQEVSEESVLNTQAYLLFYERIF